MEKMTEEFLKNALAGESQAHIKYAAFSDTCPVCGTSKDKFVKF
jgi:rubrerythrin